MSAEFILHNVIRKLGEIRDSGMLPGIDDTSRPDEILGALFERYKDRAIMLTHQYRMVSDFNTFACQEASTY